MKIKEAVLVVMAIWLGAQPLLVRGQEHTAAALNEAQYERKVAKLQDSFAQFPILTPAVNVKGQVEFQTSAMTNPVVIDAVNYYGFRFKVPKREKGENLVAAMILPAGRSMAGDFAVPETGGATVFETHLQMAKTNYLGTSLLEPLKQDTLLIRIVSGNDLRDGDTYLMWWTINGNPTLTSLAFAFAASDANAPDDLAAAEKALGLVHASSSPVVLLNPPGGPGLTRTEQLRASFDQFPLLQPATNMLGKSEFQTCPVMEPVIIGTNNYCGFRFKVPKRTNAEDFVWGFIRPVGMVSWYILPERGEMHGFENYRYMPKTNYVNAARLLPKKQKQMILQSLTGESFVDGETYLIWWELTKPQKPLSLVFAFVPLGPDGLNNQQPPMEKALGLVPASAQPEPSP